MAVFLPFEAAHFTIDEFDNPEIMFVNVMMLIIYWFDNIFHLRTTYLENENEIIDGKMILKKQSLNLTFFLMIITSIPFFFWIKLGAGNDLTFREKNLLYIQMVRVFLPHKGNHSFISNIKFGLLWRMLMTFWRVYLAVKSLFPC